MALTLIILFTVSFLALAMAHVFPWRVVKLMVDESGKLYPVSAYIVGVTIMLIMFAVWALETGNHEALAVLAVISIGAGLGTTLPRIVQIMVRKIDDAEREAQKSQLYEARIKELEADANERHDPDSN